MFNTAVQCQIQATFCRGHKVSFGVPLNLRTLFTGIKARYILSHSTGISRFYYVAMLFHRNTKLTGVQSCSYFLNIDFTALAPDFQPSNDASASEPLKYLSLAQQYLSSNL